jgi:hypothetical protein
VETFEQDILPSELSGTTTNSVIITNSDLLNAFSSRPLGTIFTPSIVTTYEGFPSGDILSTPSVSNYVPKKITPSLSLADILDKLTTDASFSVASLVSKEGTGVLSYSSSNTSVATVNSSTGQVTIVGAGTTSITVSLAASFNQVYTAATPVSKTLIIKITPSLSLADILDKLTTDASFSVASLVSKEGTGVLSYSSSNTSVATINSSTGQVTIVGEGTTTITVSLAASADQVYAAATPVSKTLTVSSIPVPNPWTQRGADINGEADDFTGRSVSLSADGTIVAIGAKWNSGNSSYAGHVRVYQYDATKTTAQTDQSLPNFGPAGWNRLGADIDGENVYDYSGESVSLSADGTILAIGAPNNNGNGSYAGHVRVYQYDATKTTAQTDQSLPNFGPAGWNRLGADIDGENVYDNSGRSVSLSADGTIVAIGAPYNNGNSSYAGHVRVYQYDATKTTAQTDQSLPNFGPAGWNRLGADIDGENVYDNSGLSVSLSADGTIVAIGAVYNNGNDSDLGHVRVYQYDATKTTAQTDQSLPNFGPVGWNRLGDDIDGEALEYYSGWSVSLSADGTRLAIGAPSYQDNESYAGHVRVYQYDATKTTAQMDQSLSNFGPVGWNRLGADIDGEAVTDRSGYSVSLSTDVSGNSIVAIGAPNNNNTYDSGHVRVYRYDATKTTAQLNQSLPNFGPVGWNRLGADIDGEAANHYSGESVSLSADGTILAIGAPYNNGNGYYAGRVRVYQYDE